MPELPDYLEQHMSESILGRAKLKLYEEISGRKHCLPGDIEVLRFIRKEFRENPELGKLFLILLTEDFLRSSGFSEVNQPEDVRQLLNRLEDEPFDGASLLQVTDCPKPLAEVLGACVFCEALADGGYVYVLTLFNDKKFPKAWSGRVEVRANRHHPEPMFSVCNGAGFDHYHLADYRESWYAAFALGVLNYLVENQPRSLVP
jgi:hypothetical protein